MRTQNSSELTRRRFLAAGATLVVAPTVACSKGSPGAEAEHSAKPVAAATIAAAGIMSVHKDPGCACCSAWADLARKAGYQVTVTEDQDMPSYKRRLGVPEPLWSCHTAQVAGYAFEGHVPLQEVSRLVASADKGVAGLAVAGMPRGSPGMEMPDGSTDPFRIVAFSSSGETSIFSEHSGEG